MPKVLVIEDDRAIQKRISHDLRGRLCREDIELIEAHDAAEAEQLVVDHKDFDAIVLDGCLDGDRADGAELISFIREHHPVPKPIIAISKSDTLRKLMVEMGCTHECRKNAVPGMIIEILGEAEALH
jgi:CheY-like chemotaxis protein